MKQREALNKSGKSDRTVKRCRIAILLAIFLTTVILLAAGCKSAQGTSESEISSEQMDVQYSETPVILENLKADGSLLCQNFYQAGNVNGRMQCYVGRIGDNLLSESSAVF